MPRKDGNYSDNFCYVCGDLTFKDQRRSLIPLVKKVMIYTLAAKWGIKIRIGPLISAV